ncbi:MAG: RICIN domain-containing protein [Ruminococcus sp.]|nr:RICIN domain-containing protein [Ruminococcus sp.]
MICRKRLLSGLLAATTLLSTAPALTFGMSDTADAAESYAKQEFLIGIGDTNRNVNVFEAEAGGAIFSDKINGTDAEEWSLNYVSAGVYEIVHAATGLVLTAGSGSCSIAADTDGANQRWKIEGVQTDHEGYYLYYKIVTNDSGQALTFTPETNSFSLSSYGGNIYQKYKLNLDGLEGYAANCKVSQGEKAGTIGGLLGDTVFVSTDSEMISALSSDDPLTIVMTKTIDFHPYGQLRVKSNKTITGYYGVTLKDCQLRTNNQAGNDSSNKPSDNIVIRNLTLLAKDSLNCILVNVYSSRNIWIDHCTFNSELGRTKDEVGKFIWINTPYDGVDLQRSPDYATISYCSFNNRYWTVAYGTQNGETTRCRTSLMYNWWNNCVRRTPQIGNGSGHIYNDYHSFSGSGASSQIIGGDGSNILSENCRFEGLSGLEIEGGGGSSSLYTDSGSYAGTSALNFSPKYKSSLSPSSHYGYSLIKAYDGSGNDTKKFCQSYAGAFNALDKIKYITDNDLAGWITKKYDSPFLKDIEVGEFKNGKAGAVIDTTHKYQIVNANSNLFLEVAGSVAAAGTNVQQGSTGATIWTMEDAGDGYYRIYSELGDGKTYLLDVDYGKPDNGTNIGIYTNTNADAQLFKFVANDDGTYVIVTKSTADGSCLGVVSDSKEEGTNVVQWACNGGVAQNWKLNIYVDPQNGTLIKNLMVEDLNTYKNWSIASSIAAGDLVFGDRDVTYASLPDSVASAEYIRTACDAKNSTETLATFEAAADIVVYVGMDKRVATLPEWLSTWTNTGESAVNSKDVTFNLYKKEIKQGETVTLGTNGQSASCVNYTVFAVPAAVTTSTTEATTTTTTTTTTETTTATTTTTTEITTTTSATTTSTTTETTATTTETTETTAETTETTTSATETATTTATVTSETSSEETTTTTTAATTITATESTTESATSMTTSATTPVSAETTTTTATTSTVIISDLCGDVNLDGKTTLLDVVYLNKYIAKVLDLNDVQISNADCCDDNKINGSDVSALIRLLVRLITALPVLPQ